MALQIAGNNGVLIGAGDTSFRGLNTHNMPLGYGSFGHYQVAVSTGTMAAALAANAVVFSFRWGDATRLCVLTWLKVYFQTLTPFTAATLADFGFDAYAGRSFTASHTGGTGLTLTGNSFKTRTSMGTTLVTDVRIATTAALAGGTITVDANAFAQSLGDNQRVNPAAATEEVPSQLPLLEWAPRPSDGEHPLVFAQNEGFVIRNRTVWPAAGTGIIQVHARWAEVSAYPPV